MAKTSLKQLDLKYNHVSQLISDVMSCPDFEQNARALTLESLDEGAMELRRIIDQGVMRKSCRVPSAIEMAESLLDTACYWAEKYTHTTDHNAWSRA